MKTYRFFLLADTLFSQESIFEDERFFPPQLEFIRKYCNDKPARKILEWFDRNSQEKLALMIDAARRQGPFDGIIGVGNYTSGAQERGMITPKCIMQGRVFKQHVEQGFPGILKLWVPGNHDLGYSYQKVSQNLGFRIGTELGGPSEKSIQAYQDFFGPVFGVRDLGPCVIVWISSVIMRNVYDSSPNGLVTLREKQESFLERVLREPQQKPLFLVLHDPKALSYSPAIMQTLLTSKAKIAAIIHGHMKSWVGRYASLVSPFYGRLSRDFETILAYSPCGMFGIGKGISFLECDEAGSWRISNVPI